LALDSRVRQDVPIYCSHLGEFVGGLISQVEGGNVNAEVRSGDLNEPWLEEQSSSLVPRR